MRRAYAVVLGVLAAGAAALFTAMQWWSADLESQAFRFYSSSYNDGQQIDEETYRYYDRLSSNGFLLNQVSQPFIVIALVAVMALLAVLAYPRFDPQYQRAPGSRSVSTRPGCSG